MIFKSIRICFDEIKEVSETSITNNTSGLVPQRQKALDYDNPDPVPQRQDVFSSADEHVPSQQELDLLFGHLYDEFFNAGSNPQDKKPSTNIPSTSAPSTHINVRAEENNNDQAEEGEHLQDDEFTNSFCAPTQDVADSFHLVWFLGVTDRVVCVFVGSVIRCLDRDIQVSKDNNLCLRQSETVNARAFASQALVDH
nr:hypothetical protein [Tanacetum cinerariifolium]